MRLTLGRVIPSNALPPLSLSLSPGNTALKPRAYAHKGRTSTRDIRAALGYFHSRVSLRGRSLSNSLTEISIKQRHVRRRSVVIGTVALLGKEKTEIRLG